MRKTVKPSEKTELKSVRFSVQKFAVDTSTGVLHDLALITADREAKGHGIYIDAKTLEGGLASIKERGGQLKGAICHETFDQWWNEEDRLLEVPGWFDGISIEGGILKAGDFSFYESFKEDQPAAYKRVLEMAEKTPNLFGLSIEASGYAVYVDTQGNEYSQRPEDVELMYEGMPAFRIVDLDAAAFVSEPAANDGLFAAAMSKMGFGKMGKKEAQQIGEAIAAWNAEHGKKEFSHPGSAGPKPTSVSDPMKELLAKFKAKCGDDQARYNRGVLYVANHSDPDSLTVEALESALDKAELDALRKENTELKNKPAKPEGEAELSVEQKQANEIADLKKRLGKKENSGAGGDLELGAPAIVGSGFKFTGQTADLIEKGIVPVETADKWRKKFAAGTTSVSDLWVPSIYVQGMAEMSVNRPVFITSGAVARNTTLDTIATGGGVTANIPHFVEPYFDSLLQSESTAPTLQKFSSSTNIAAFLRRVSPISVSAFAGAISGSDPVGFILGILMNLRNKQDQTTLINQLRGFLGTAGAALSKGAFSESIAGQTADDFFDSDMFADAIAALGEAADLVDRGAMIVHPDIHAAMIKQDDVEDVRDSEGNLIIRTYKNIPLFMSSQASRAGTTDGTVYETYVFGPGTVGMGQKAQSSTVGDTASLLIDESESTNDVSVYDRRQFILHPNGAKWTGTPASANSGPTDAELATTTNWALGNSDVQTCGFLRIRSNG